MPVLHAALPQVSSCYGSFTDGMVILLCVFALWFWVHSDFCRITGLSVILCLYVKYYQSQNLAVKVMEQGLVEMYHGSSLCEHVSENGSSGHVRGSLFQV